MHYTGIATRMTTRMTKKEVQKMEGLPAYYTVLFNAVTDAIDALDRQDLGQARLLLVQGQQQAEDAYLDAAGE